VSAARGFNRGHERTYERRVMEPALREVPREQWDGRRALRRAGLTAREELRSTGKLGARAGRGAARAAGFQASSWTSLLLYMLASVVLLALLKTALEGRGPAAVEKSLAWLGGAWGRLFSPEDPLIARGPAEAPGAALADASAAAVASGAVATGSAAVARFVRVGPNANRPGAALKPQVIAFVGAIGARLGKVLTIGTGTNHSRTTLNGNESDHWTGWAADIPAKGAENVRIGRAALVQAGMPAAQANRQNGGLYNVGGYQIIFNANSVAVGGDHTDHVHVGIRHH
jgi:hypothetical protein